MINPKDRYKNGHWFTINYVPHEVVKYENEFYEVIYGYPRPNEENIRYMTHRDIAMLSD